MSWLPGHDERRGPRAQALDEQVRRLELAVPGALGEVARDDDGGGVEGGEKVVERLDLLEVGEAAEVQVGEVNDRDVSLERHQITRMRYVSAGLAPWPGPAPGNG